MEHFVMHSTWGNDHHCSVNFSGLLLRMPLVDLWSSSQAEHLEGVTLKAYCNFNACNLRDQTVSSRVKALRLRKSFSLICLCGLSVWPYSLCVCVWNMYLYVFECYFWVAHFNTGVQVGEGGEVALWRWRLKQALQLCKLWGHFLSRWNN